MSVADFIDGIIPILLGALIYALGLKQKNNSEKMKKAGLIVIGVGIFLLIIKLF